MCVDTINKEAEHKEDRKKDERKRTNNHFHPEGDQSIWLKHWQGFIKLASENNLFLMTKPAEKPSLQSRLTAVFGWAHV